MIETVSDLVRDLQSADQLRIHRGYSSREIAVLLPDGTTSKLVGLVSFPPDLTVYLQLEDV